MNYLLQNLFAINIWADTGCAGGNPDTCGVGSVVKLIGNFIRLGLFAAGLLAVIMIIVGGFQYITSSGNPQATARAKSTITYAIIGLLIAIFAFAIVNFIIERLT